jgi:hypothetical protein
MDPVRWRQIEEMFHTALQEPRVRRREYLASACHTDPELHEEVLSLLEAHETSGDVFASATPLTTEAPPASISDFRGTGRFHLIERLGEGGFGVVYSARDQQTGDLVALKVLRESSGDAIYRFKREFRSLADIVHPHLVSLLELFSEQGVWFFTMELVHGSSFVQDARQHSRPFDRVRHTLPQLVEGLNALHAAGKLHRDVKPANVLVTSQGQAKILDFGLARETAPFQSLSSAHVAGTPAYMAPEALRGQSSPAGDWYAVGVLLYEALAGRLPFSGTVSEMLEAKAAAEPPALADAAHDMPGDLQAVCRDLLRPDPAQRPSGREILRRLSEPATVELRSDASALAANVPFVGRERELAALRDAFEAAAHGAVLVPIGGPSGVGKTSLMRRFVTVLRKEHDDLLVLAGRCFERESIPYKAVDSLVDELSRYLRALPLSEAEALLPPELLALTRLFPVLHTVPAVMTARRRLEDASDAVELRMRGFAGLRSLLSRLAARARLIVLLDDLQWGDADSAALLRQLLGPPEPPRLLVLGCYRSEDRERSAFLRAMAPLIRNAPDVRPLELAAFNGEEARALALSLLPSRDRALAEGIAAQSAGSPIFIELMARDASAVPDGGLTVDEVLLRRVRRLPEAAQRLLAVVAVAGQPIDARAAHVAAEADPAGGRLVAQLKTERLLRAAGTSDAMALEVYHDRIRAAVQTLRTPAASAELTRRLARALEDTGTEKPELLATLYELAGDPSRAAMYAGRSAEAAARALAFDQAARFYRLAFTLDAAGRSGLRPRLADALIHAGRGPEAAEVLLDAAAEARPEDRLDLRRRAADQLLRAGLIDEGLDVLKQVLQTLGWQLAKTPGAAARRFVAESAWLMLRGFNFRQRPATDVPPRERLRIDTASGVSEALSLVDNVQAAAFAARTARLALRIGEPVRVARSLAVLGAFWGFRGGKWGRASAALSQATHIAERLADPRLQAMTLFACAAAAYGAGRFEECVHLCRSSLAKHRESGSSGWERSSVEILLYSALVYVGQWKQIQPRLAALLDDARARGDRFLTMHVLTRQTCFVRLINDDVVDAERAVEEGIASWTHRGFHLQHYWGLLGRVEVALYRADGERAWRLVTEHLPDVRRSLLHRSAILETELLWLYGRAALAAIRRVGRPAARAASTAARYLQRSRAPSAKACGLCLTAGLLSNGRREVEAARALEQAASLFERDGMAAYAALTRRWQEQVLGACTPAAAVYRSDDMLGKLGIAALGRLTRLYHPLARSD